MRTNQHEADVTNTVTMAKFKLCSDKATMKFKSSKKRKKKKPTKAQLLD